MPVVSCQYPHITHHVYRCLEGAIASAAIRDDEAVSYRVVCRTFVCGYMPVEGTFPGGHTMHSPNDDEDIDTSSHPLHSSGYCSRHSLVASVLR